MQENEVEILETNGQSAGSSTAQAWGQMTQFNPLSLLSGLKGLCHEIAMVFVEVEGQGTQFKLLSHLSGITRQCHEILTVL
jgi:hypothetical protein